MHLQILIKCHRFVYKILNGSEKLTITKDHMSFENSRKLTRNNPNLNLVMVNAYTNSAKILSICSQEIEHKQSFDNN